MSCIQGYNLRDYSILDNLLVSKNSILINVCSIVKLTCIIILSVTSLFAQNYQLKTGEFTFSGGVVSLDGYVIKGALKFVAGSATGDDYRLNGGLFIRTDIDLPEQSVNLPLTFSVSQNYPNPFNPNTTIKFTIPKDTKVRLIVYNLLGQEVVRLVDRPLKSGSYDAVWNGTDFRGKHVTSGIYVYRLEAGEFVETKKMIILK